MAFDLNKNGNIDSLPLFTWETAVIADAGCLLRLVLSRSSDQSDRDKTAVQLSMSAEQVGGLVSDLQKILAHISRAQSNTQIH
jgi:hypothetical protein